MFQEGVGQVFKQVSRAVFGSVSKRLGAGRGRGAAVLAALLVALLVPAAGPAKEPRKGSAPLKQLMGENFAGIQKILVALVTANYADVPADAEVIREHASQLTQLIPASAEKNREQFLALAYNLEGNARNLGLIVQQLIDKDAQHKEGGLGTDYLRDVAASHFGGMVTMCVACHNRFHPRIAR